MARYSEAYIQHVIGGPFPGQIDPWAESSRFFHQLHGEMISHLLSQVQEPLLAMGYIAGRETSLQIAENRQQDIYVERQGEQPGKRESWDYTQAAEAVRAEPGIMLEGIEPELDALHLKEVETGRLVTVVEVVSPRNKTENALIRDYQERRERLLRRDVNVVEIDLTRSVKRLVLDMVVESFPYHVAVHLSDQMPRLIGIEFAESLKRCAIPLRAEVIPVELQPAYDHAYRQTSLAGHIQADVRYSEDSLPFPSLLTADQRTRIFQAVGAWQQKLAELQAA